MPFNRYLVIISIFAGFMLMSGPSHATFLSKEQILEAIIGKTLAIKKLWMTIKITYQYDGVVTVDGPMASGAGKWHFNEEGLCMIMENGFPVSNKCTTFTALGDQKYRNGEGVTMTVMGVADN